MRPNSASAALKHLKAIIVSQLGRLQLHVERQQFARCKQNEVDFSRVGQPKVELYRESLQLSISVP